MTIFATTLLIIACSEKKIDTVEGNENEVKPEAVADFEYTDVNGNFKGKFNQKDVSFELDNNQQFKLNYQGKTFEGIVYLLGNDGKIELESSNGSLPFALIKIEDPSFLVILEDGNENENYLEKSN